MDSSWRVAAATTRAAAAQPITRPSDATDIELAGACQGDMDFGLGIYN